MKTVSKDGRTWFEKRDGKTYVGFTKEFLDSLDGCWHIIPAANNKTAVKEDSPLCAVETNDGLFSIPSPVTGIIAVFENAAMNFPDKLKEDNAVAVMSDQKVAEQEELTRQEELRRQLDAMRGGWVQAEAVQPVIDPDVVARIQGRADAARREVAQRQQPQRANLDFFVNAGAAPVVNERNVWPARRGENR